MIIKFGQIALPMYPVLAVCGSCGACVRPGMEQAHQELHNELEALRAQAATANPKDS